MMSTGILAGITCLLFIQVVDCLRMVSLEVPTHAVAGRSIQLKCVFDLEDDDLYSVKWYKANQEFYRFLPKEKPPVHVFSLNGVYIEMAQSNEKTVTLETVDLDSSGVYRCEVSAEAPSFQTVSMEKLMTAIDLPKDGPKISGGRTKYNIGDNLRVNCTSGKSKPAANLMWYINEIKAPATFVHLYQMSVDENMREMSVLGLEFIVREDHFKNGDMKLKCTATIYSMYHQTNEQSVPGENKRLSVLESREKEARKGVKSPMSASGAGMVHYSAILLITLSAINVCLRVVSSALR